MGTISGELFNYAVLAANTIHSTYLLAFQKNYLTEAYEPLNITPKNIQSSLATIAYEYQSSNNKNDDFLLDLLNKEFGYIHIEFRLINNNSKRLKYPTSGIISAEADINDTIIIYITEMFLNLVRNLDLDIDSDKVSRTLTEDLMKIYSHEYTHEHQLEKQKVLVPGIDQTQIDEIQKIKKYLKHPREIDAHAREISTELLLTGKVVKQLIDLIKDQKSDPILVNLSRVYGLYWSYFNKFSIYNRDFYSENDDIVMAKLKEKIVEFLNQDKEVINKNSIIYRLKHKK